MRAAIDITFLALLALTAGAYWVADGSEGGVFWALLAIATVKSVLIQAVFMKLTRRPWLLVALASGSVCVGMTVGVLLGA